MIWKECSKGHDLTVEDAWIYRSSGMRDCRQCVTPNSKKRGKFRFEMDVNTYPTKASRQSPAR